MQSALQYFRVGGQRHTADEEESLFPRLRAESAAGNFEELGGLENDHRDANDLHLAVDALYSAWIAAGLLSPEDEQRLLSATERLKHLYEEHIQVEEDPYSRARPRCLTAEPSPTSGGNSTPGENSSALR